MAASLYLTLLVAIPLFGGFIILGIEEARQALARKLALVFTALAGFVALAAWAAFNPASGELQFVVKLPWIPALGVDYFVGLDGLGLAMVLLTALLVPMALLTAPRNAPPLQLALMLLLQAGLFGTFTALNFFHWFLFWELSLIPAFFLIKLWGGPERGAAATQFFVYTMVGSVALLLSFLAIFLATGVLDFIKLADLAQKGELAADLAAKLGWPQLSAGTVSMIIFGGVLLGFAVKVPLFPFHTWLPATYAEAPTSTTMLLTGAMSKMGVYGFLRILAPIFPEQMRQAQTPLLWLAVGTIVLSAAAAFAQRDLKRILAYSSINHLGYCLLGVFAAAGAGAGAVGVNNVERAAALSGVIVQMFNHGVTAAVLFCFVSFIENRADGLRGRDDFGGLRKVAPVFCGLMGIALFASIGLPGLSGFVGEFLIFKGAFSLAPWAAAGSTLGLLVTAVFLLTLMQRVFQGPLNPRWAGFADLTFRERLLVLPAIVLIFVLGIYPQALIGLTNATVIRMAREFAL